jgi:hypothetical protein
MPMGIALLIAARNPAQHRLLFGFVVAGSVLHAVNHLLDELVQSGTISCGGLIAGRAQSVWKSAT